MAERRARTRADRKKQVATVRALLPLEAALVDVSELQYWLDCAVKKVGLTETKALRLRAGYGYSVVER